MRTTSLAVCGRGMFRKALAIYAAAFVVVAVIAKAAIVGIGLPEWVFTGSLVVMRSIATRQVAALAL